MPIDHGIAVALYQAVCVCVCVCVTEDTVDTLFTLEVQSDVRGVYPKMTQIADRTDLTGQVKNELLLSTKERTNYERVQTEVKCNVFCTRFSIERSRNV